MIARCGRLYLQVAMTGYACEVWRIVIGGAMRGYDCEVWKIVIAGGDDGL